MGTIQKEKKFAKNNFKKYHTIQTLELDAFSTLLVFRWPTMLSRHFHQKLLSFTKNLRSYLYLLLLVNPNWHEGRHFYLIVLFGSYFFSWIFIKNLQTFLEEKIDINRVNLTPCQAHWVLWKNDSRWL